MSDDQDAPAVDLYDEAFFRQVEEDSLRSAAAAVPLVLAALPSRRVLDVGSGEGAWAAQFARHGCQVLALDGDYVERSRLRVPPESFIGHDLLEPLPPAAFEFRADLTVCLEVAEHLPHSHGPGLVADLCRTSDRLLFSAAVPGQTGHGHINEQPPEYWIELLEDQGFAVSKALQRTFGQVPDIAWWYQRNVMIAVRVTAVNPPIPEWARGVQGVVRWARARRAARSARV